LAQFAHAKAAFEHDFAILIKADGHTRDAQCRPSLLNEFFDSRDPFLVERRELSGWQTTRA
jgi:hypothetical protein